MAQDAEKENQESDSNPWVRRQEKQHVVAQRKEGKP